ncbi:MAG: 4Fe-4S dicluster domain-containing protein [Candidatus Hodarchaeota archaeon]
MDLTVDFSGLEFRNPILTAAGPQSRDGNTLIAAANGGAGALVAKTISIEPAIVAKPNMAVVDRTRKSLVNVELWSELTPEQWLSTEYQLAKSPGLPLIGSVGYTAEEVAKLAPQMVEAGCDAIEFSLHYVEAAEEIPKALKEVVEVPIIAKLSPHRSPEIEELINRMDPYVDGYTAINSFGPVLHIDIETAQPVLGGPNGHGWISGWALRPLAVRCVADIARATKKPIIGIGGVFSGKDALEHIMCGATAVGVCSAAILLGQTIYGKIASEISTWLKSRGYDTIEDIRGKALSNLPAKSRRTHIIPPTVTENCNLCKLCIKSCAFGALSIKENELIVDEIKCAGCGLCTTVCPREGITIQ